MRRYLGRRLVKAAVVAALTVAFLPVWTAHAAPVESLQPVYRFYNETNGSHFYTANAEECAQVKAKYPTIYVYEGIAYRTLTPEFIAQGGIGATMVPLYRFYNKKNGSHFYTISEVEKAYVQAKYSAVYTLEGVAYSVFADDNEQPVMPVHRFYNKKNGSHFYTISDTEKMYVRMQFSDTYRYEGIAFYAIPNDLFYVR